MAFATIEQVGPSFEVVTARLIREVTAANKTVGREVAKVGKKAMLDDVRSRRGTLSFGGGKLNVQGDRSSRRRSGRTVTFAGVSAGAWAIISTGTEAPPDPPRNGQGVALGWRRLRHVMCNIPARPAASYWQSRRRPPSTGPWPMSSRTSTTRRWRPDGRP